MRTTITLEPDVDALLKQSMRKQGLTFKQAVNQAVRKGLLADAGRAPAFRQRTVHLGRPRVDLTKALSLADELDDLDHGYRPR